MVRISKMPQETSTCEVAATVDYAMVRLNRGDFLLPQQGRFHVLLADTEENDVTAVYTGCREYQSESAIHFEDYPAAGSAAKAGPSLPWTFPQVCLYRWH